MVISFFIFSSFSLIFSSIIQLQLFIYQSNFHPLHYATFVHNYSTICATLQNILCISHILTVCGNFKFSNEIQLPQGRDPWTISAPTIQWPCSSLRQHNHFPRQLLNNNIVAMKKSNSLKQHNHFPRNECFLSLHQMIFQLRWKWENGFITLTPI